MEHQDVVGEDGMHLANAGNGLVEQEHPMAQQEDYPPPAATHDEVFNDKGAYRAAASSTTLTHVLGVHGSSV